MLSETFWKKTVYGKRNTALFCETIRFRKNLDGYEIEDKKEKNRPDVSHQVQSETET